MNMVIMSPVETAIKQNVKVESSELENGLKMFVGGLNLDTDDNSLEYHFSQYGTLTEARVIKDDRGCSSKGFGFITYSTQAEINACQDARPHFIDGSNVSTFRYVPKEQDKRNMGYMDVPRGHCKKLYVSNLNEDVKAEELKAYFGQYGNVINVDIKSGVNERQLNATKNGKFAFVQFDDYDPVDKCIILEKHKIGGRAVMVRRALSKNHPGDNLENKIFVGPLEDELTDETLNKYFSEFGKVKRVERPLDKRSGKRRDFAFIEFDNLDSIEKIIKCEEHQIGRYEVRVKKVTQKDWSQRTGGGISNQEAMWNQVNFNPIGVFDQSGGFGMPFNQGFGAFYPGFPTQHRGYGMQIARMAGPLKNVRAPGRFNPYAAKEMGRQEMESAKVVEHNLTRYFSNFGNVIKVDRPWDAKNQRKRDYAFVEFEDPNSVRMCMLYTGHQIMGHNLIVRRGSTKGETMDMERKIFVDLKGKSRSN